MSRPTIDREALIAALAEQARSGAGGSEEPEPEELLDYLAGRLSLENEQRIDRQLVASPDAARALLDLADLEAAGAAAGRHPSELAAQAGWRDLKGRLPGAPALFRRLPPLLTAVAATLLLTTLGFGFWMLKLREELSRPVANVKSLDLVADRRAAGDEIQELAPGAALRLVLSVDEPCSSYEAVVERPGSRQRVGGLKRDDGGNVTLMLRGVVPGAYRLRLSGCEPRREVENYSWQIVPPGLSETDGD